jgi:hypothetical protein
MKGTLADALRGADAVVFAVRHEAYLKLEPEEVVRMAGRPVAVVDCFGILNDGKIRRYFELGCEVKGLGRGHVKRIKDEVQKTAHGTRRKHAPKGIKRAQGTRRTAHGTVSKILLSVYCAFAERRFFHFRVPSRIVHADIL